MEIKSRNRSRVQALSNSVDTVSLTNRTVSLLLTAVSSSPRCTDPCGTRSFSLAASRHHGCSNRFVSGQGQSLGFVLVLALTCKHLQRLSTVTIQTPLRCVQLMVFRFSCSAKRTDAEPPNVASWIMNRLKRQNLPQTVEFLRSSQTLTESL